MGRKRGYPAGRPDLLPRLIPRPILGPHRATATNPQATQVSKRPAEVRPARFFGPNAEARVWVVIDGDVLYLDRNGNGDLTEPGERFDLEVTHFTKEVRDDAQDAENDQPPGCRAGAGEAKDDTPILACATARELVLCASPGPRAKDRIRRNTGRRTVSTSPSSRTAATSSPHRPGRHTGGGRDHFLRGPEDLQARSRRQPDPGTAGKATILSVGIASLGLHGRRGRRPQLCSGTVPSAGRDRVPLQVSRPAARAHFLVFELDAPLLRHAFLGLHRESPGSGRWAKRD